MTTSKKWKVTSKKIKKKKMEDDLKKKKRKKMTLTKMEDEPINQNYLICCDTIENSPSLLINYYILLPEIQVKLALLVY